jgi:capsular polysaccharide biosynthesis protein
MPFAGIARHLLATSYTLPAGISQRLKGMIFCAPNSMLLTRSRKIIAEASSTEREPRWFKWSDLFLHETEHMDGCCSSIRSLRNNYYHTLVDNLPRLFLLHHPAYADRDIRLLFTDGPTAIESFFLSRLCPPNVTVVKSATKRLYSFDEFLFPEFLSRRFAACLPPVYVDYFQSRVLPKRARRKTNRILISRVRANNGRAILNEEELAHALAPLGFKSYVLEDLDLQSQINLFYDAEAVVAPHGSGLANLLYAHSIDVLELHPNPFLFPHYYFLCKALQHRYRYWCSTEDTRFSSFSVDVKAVIKHLQEGGLA